jgi:hypothetical protein
LPGRSVSTRNVARQSLNRHPRKHSA